MPNISIQPKNTYVWNFLIPGGALIGIPAINHHFFSGMMMAPMCNFAALALLALYISPRIMMMWIPLFVFSTLLVLIPRDAGMHGSHGTANPLLIRYIGIAVGGAVTLFLCVTRAQISKTGDKLLLFLKRMPSPFVLSDEKGTVLFVNEQAARILKISQEESHGSSYFSLLENLSNKGTAVQTYLSVLKSPGAEEIQTKFRPRNNAGIVLNGMLVPLQMGKDRLVVTMISEEIMKDEGKWSSGIGSQPSARS